MVDHVEKVLDKYVRPALSEHCGGLEVTKVEDNVVHVRLLGQCAGCASAYYTLDELIEKEVKKHIPSISKVVLHTYDDDMLELAKRILHHEAGPVNLRSGEKGRKEFVLRQEETQ